MPAQEATGIAGRDVSPRVVAAAVGFVLLNAGLFIGLFWPVFYGEQYFSINALARLFVAIELAACAISILVWMSWTFVARFVLGASRTVSVLACVLGLLAPSVAWTVTMVDEGLHFYTDLGTPGYVAAVLGFRFVLPMLCCGVAALALWRRGGEVREMVGENRWES